MKLELGSGYSPTSGFVHLDVNPNAPDVDIVGSVFPLCSAVYEMAPFAELRAVDVLEHLSYRDTGRALRQWSTVLVPGGQLFVQVPDADTIMRWYVQSEEQLWRRLPKELPPTCLAGAAWRLLGGHDDGTYVHDGDDWRWNAHYSLWSVDSLTSALRNAGFYVDSLERNEHPNLLCWAIKR